MLKKFLIKDLLNLLLKEAEKHHKDLQKILEASSTTASDRKRFVIRVEGVSDTIKIFKQTLNKI